AAARYGYHGIWAHLHAEGRASKGRPGLAVVFRNSDVEKFLGVVPMDLETRPGHILKHYEPFGAFRIREAMDSGYIGRATPVFGHRQPFAPGLTPVGAPPDHRRSSVAQRIHDKYRLTVAQEHRVWMSQVVSWYTVDNCSSPGVIGNVDLWNTAHVACLT